MSDVKRNDNEELEIAKNECAILLDVLPHKYFACKEKPNLKVFRGTIISIEKGKIAFNSRYLTVNGDKKATAEKYAKDKDSSSKEEIQDEISKLQRKHKSENSKCNKQYNADIMKINSKFSENIKNAEKNVKAIESKKPIEPIRTEISKVKLFVFPWLNKKQELLNQKFEKQHNLWEKRLKQWQQKYDEANNILNNYKNELNQQLGELENNHSQKLAQMEEDFQQKLSQLNYNLKNRHKLAIDEWNERNLEAEEVLKEVDDKLKTISVLPPKYRKYYYAEKIYDIICNRKVDNLKEVLAITEDEIAREEFHDRIISELEKRNNILEDSEKDKIRAIEEEYSNRQAELERHNEEMERLADEQSKYAQTQARAYEEQTSLMREQARRARQAEQNKPRNTFGSTNIDTTKCLMCKKRHECNKVFCSGYVPG